MFISAVHLDPLPPLTCSYSAVISFFPPPSSSSSSFGSRLNLTNSTSLISFLWAPAMTGPRWPFLAGCVCIRVCLWMCVVALFWMCADVHGYKAHVTKCMHACECVCACMCAVSSVDMIVCDQDSHRGRLLFFVSGFRDSGILSSFLSPVTCFMTSC